MTITALGLDADDTLWHSESHFAVTEQLFRDLLAPWMAADVVAERLLERERANLALFGYGAKGFTLSMIETALEASGGSLPGQAVQQIVDWGKELLSHPVDLLDDVEATVETLADRYRLVLITKGDLFHQESKVAESGLADHFERIEILSEKSPSTYRAVLGRLDVDVDEFVMVGNSVRSDVLPVVEMGSRAIHIPYQVTWGHEVVDGDDDAHTWHQIDRIAELPGVLAGFDR
ncbi:MAG: HAD family hydrolase [Actinomycetota bacterium]